MTLGYWLAVAGRNTMLVAALLGPLAGRAEELPGAPPAKAAASQQACSRGLPGRRGASIESAAGSVVAACFFGPITRDSANEFLSLPIPDGTPLVLDSGGGDVDGALDMAERILDRHLPVVVSRTCLSSCANYLFVAGATKVVLPDSFVGWHGGPPKEPPPNLTELGRENLTRTLAKQEAFFRRVGVDDQLIYLPRPGSGVTQKNRGNRFWTWSADELRERFGVQGIVWMWQHLPSPRSTGAEEH